MLLLEKGEKFNNHSQTIGKKFGIQTNITNNKQYKDNILTYQCKGLLPSLSGTSGSAFHFETIWYRKAV